MHTDHAPSVPSNHQSPAVRWRAAGLRVIGPLRQAAIASALLAAATSVATAAPPPHGGPFLDATRTMDCNSAASCEELAKAYYRYIGVYNAQNLPTADRGSLAGWKRLHGFSADPQVETEGEVRVSYFNVGDLRIGRDMHCRVYPTPVSGPVPFTFKTLACYVTNFGDGIAAQNDFGVSSPGPAIANAQAATSDPHRSIATVVMDTVYAENFGFRESEVFFAAYGNDDAPLPLARLDVSANKTNFQAVPGTCLSCHGGFGRNGIRSKVELAGGQVVVQNARFLPFDPFQFLFGDGTRRVPNADEQEKFRKLNAMIRDLYAPWSTFPIRELIDGWYGWCGGVKTAGCTIDEAGHPFVPAGVCTPDVAGIYRSCGWTTGKPPFADRKPGFDIQAFYKGVVGPYCRTCHIASPERFNVQNYGTFASGNAVLPRIHIRENFKMPFAEATYNNFYADASAQTLLRQYLDNIAVPVPVTPLQLCLGSCGKTRDHCMRTATNIAARARCIAELKECRDECRANHPGP